VTHKLTHYYVDNIYTVWTWGSTCPKMLFMWILSIGVVSTVHKNY